MSFISTSSALGLISLHRFRTMIVASSCALVFNIVLGIVLVSSLGAEGGALADVLTETLMAIGLTVVLMRAVPRRQVGASSFVPPLVLASALYSRRSAPLRV
jgi:Na+-driven multidrug efflux pump